MSATILIIGDWYGSYASLSFEVGVGVRESDMSDILLGGKHSCAANGQLICGSCASDRHTVALLVVIGHCGKVLARLSGQRSTLIHHVDVIVRWELHVK